MHAAFRAANANNVICHKTSNLPLGKLLGRSIKKLLIVGACISRMIASKHTFGLNCVRNMLTIQLTFIHHALLFHCRHWLVRSVSIAAGISVTLTSWKFPVADQLEISVTTLTVDQDKEISMTLTGRPGQGNFWWVVCAEQPPKKRKGEVLEVQSDKSLKTDKAAEDQSVKTDVQELSDDEEQPKTEEKTEPSKAEKQTEPSKAEEETEEVEHID